MVVDLCYVCASVVLLLCSSCNNCVEFVEHVCAMCVSLLCHIRVFVCNAFVVQMLSN